MIEGRRIAVRQQPRACSVVVSTRSITAAAAGRSDTIAVQANADCAWTATASTSWIQLSDASGAGNGNVKFRIDANDGGPRDGAVTIGDQSIAVTQAAGGTCSFSVSPTAIEIGTAGGSGEVAVATSANCEWTVANSAQWLALPTARRTGSGVVALSAAGNSGARRTAVAQIAGVNVTVTQNGASGVTPCAYTVTPATQAVEPAGGNGKPIEVSTGASCAWTATSAVSWMTIPSGSTGTGNGTVAILVQANLGPARTGTLSIAGRAVTVTQGAAPPPQPECSYEVGPAQMNAPSTGASGLTFSVTTAVGCGWTATSQSPWIAVTSGPMGKGSGNVTVTVAANGGASRTGQLAIADTTVSITQSAPCAFEVSPEVIDIDGAGGTRTITVTTTTGCAWTVATDDRWLTVIEGVSGAGSGIARIEIAANPGENRVGTLSIGGRQVTIHQAKK